MDYIRVSKPVEIYQEGTDAKVRYQEEDIQIDEARLISNFACLNNTNMQWGMLENIMKIEPVKGSCFVVETRTPEDAYYLTHLLKKRNTLFSRKPFVFLDLKEFNREDRWPNYVGAINTCLSDSEEVGNVFVNIHEIPEEEREFIYFGKQHGTLSRHFWMIMNMSRENLFFKDRTTQTPRNRQLGLFLPSKEYTAFLNHAIHLADWVMPKIHPFEST